MTGEVPLSELERGVFFYDPGDNPGFRGQKGPLHWPEELGSAENFMAPQTTMDEDGACSTLQIPGDILAKEGGQDG